MLILEGPDLVGKTTLANKLVKRLNQSGWPHIVRHLSRLPEEWRVDAVRNYERLMNVYAVQDRFHYSEPLYAAIRGDVPFLGPSDYARVTKLLYRHSAYVVVITADEELIRQRYVAEREMYSLDQILAVNRLYMDAATGGFSGAYSMPVDQHVHCRKSNEFPEMKLEAYTARLMNDHFYAGAKQCA